MAARGSATVVWCRGGAWPLGPLAEPPAAPTAPPLASMAEPVSQVARLLMQMGSSASAMAAQTLAGAVGRALRGVLAEAPPLLHIIRPQRDAEVPRPEARTGDTLTERLAEAERVQPRAGPAQEREVSEAFLHQLLREVGTLRAETARLRREREHERPGDEPPSAGDAAEPATPRHRAAIGGEPSRPAEDEHIRRIMTAAMAQPRIPASEPDTPHTEIEDDEEVVTPTLHKAFFLWLGASGSIRQEMKMSKWTEAASKRWAMKEWKERAKAAGVDVKRLPGSLRPMVRALMAEYRAAPGAVRSTAPQS